MLIILFTERLSVNAACGGSCSGVYDPVACLFLRTATIITRRPTVAINYKVQLIVCVCVHVVLLRNAIRIEWSLLFYYKAH